MAERARVREVGALSAFRPALVKFIEESTAVVTSAEADAMSLQLRLKSERLVYWKREIRRRREAAVRAQGKLTIKQHAKDHQPRSTVDERKALEKAKRRVHEAEAKYEATRLWIRRLDKAQQAFASGMRPLKGALQAELPRGVTELDRMTDALEAYTRERPPGASRPDATEPSGGGERSEHAEGGEGGGS